MKVAIEQTVEVSDEQRKMIALKKDGPGAKKRDATRDEMKEFIWARGSEWAQWLEGDIGTELDPAEEEDLIGEGLTAADLI